MISNNKLRSAIVNEIIFRLDVAMENRQLTLEEQRFRKSMKVKCLGLDAVERCMWRQSPDSSSSKKGIVTPNSSMSRPLPGEGKASFPLSSWVMMAR
jgi:hypothetical protein